jgi:hypothetical protein
VNKTKDSEKIGTSEWITIRSHARQLYLPLAADLTSVFDLKIGDRVHVKFVEIKRKEKGGSSDE